MLRETPESWGNRLFVSLCKAFPDREKHVYWKHLGIRQLGYFAFLCYCISQFIFPRAFIPCVQWRENTAIGRFVFCRTVHVFLSGTQINWKQVPFFLVCMLKTEIYLRKNFIGFKSKLRCILPNLSHSPSCRLWYNGQWMKKMPKRWGNLEITWTKSLLWEIGKLRPRVLGKWGNWHVTGAG